MSAGSEQESASELAQPDQEHSPQPECALTVVGIGASAGGLEALKELIASLEKSDWLSYVVAQHLSPTHTSLLMELLTPGTDLAVRDLRSEQIPMPNTIYITPPSHDVEFRNGRLYLKPPRVAVGPKPSVDHFLTSLAQSQGERAVAIILSGTGTDGAAGVRAINANSGIVLVQDPESAKYDGMPRAAISTGCADAVIAPNQMGAILRKITGPSSQRTVPLDENASGLERVTALVRKAAGIDISSYKDSTLQRRLQRRMQLHDTTEIDEYASLLQRDPPEAVALARSILINVTSFFRDGPHFDALLEVLRAAFAELPKSHVIRIWVPGCSSGEEAYSIAILMNELRRESDDPHEFLIFASDIESESLATARAGIYSDNALAGMRAAWRTRYFSREGGDWIAKKELRQPIVFAAQNVIEDPPFSRVDLISCRNLLIYFTREVQKRVLELFHYSLRPGGILFLGKSESVEQHEELFEPLQRSARIYRRRQAETTYLVPLRSRPAAVGVEAASRDEIGEANRNEDNLDKRKIELLSEINARYCPPTVLVDRDDRVTHGFGEVHRVLRLPDGEMDYSIYQLAPEEIRAEMRALVHRTRRTHETLKGSKIRLPDGGEVRFEVAGLRPPLADLVCISFLPVEVADETGAPSETAQDSSRRDTLIISELENELSNTRMHLQTVAEELETANEELQSTNEELQSTNEELQSTNEELQTSNEELQSSNEELTTLNEELQQKSEQYEQVASTLISVKESQGMPLIVVDRLLQLVLTNQAAEQVIETADLKVGMPLTGVQWRSDVLQVFTLVRKVIDELTPAECLIDVGERHYLLKASPQRDSAGNPSGAVLSFVDITKQVEFERKAKTAMADLTRERDQIYTTLQAISDGVITTDGEAKVVYVNATAEELTGWKQEQAVGRPITEIYRVLGFGDASDDHIVMRCLASGASEQSPLVASTIVGRSGRRLDVHESVAPLRDNDGETRGTVLVFRDLHGQRLPRVTHFRMAQDGLTLLPNRFEFLRTLASVGVENHTCDHALLVLDIDGFRQFNDDAGVDAGDELLRQVSRGLSAALRKHDPLARIGADAFAVLIAASRAGDVRALAEKLQAVIRGCSLSEHHADLQVTACVGAYLYREQGLAAQDLLSRAESACTRARESGPDRIAIIDARDSQAPEPAIDAVDSVDEELIAALRALQFDLQFTPAHATAGSDEGVQLSLVGPEIHAGSRQAQTMTSGVRAAALLASGECVNAELAMVEQLAEHLAGVPLKTLKQQRHLVRLSADAMGQDAFLIDLEKCLHGLGKRASAICFELDETFLSEGRSPLAAFRRLLAKQDCGLVIGRFGFSGTSFLLLDDAQPEFVRLAPTLLQAAFDRETGVAAIEAIGDLCRRLEIGVVADASEDPDQLDRLATLGVTHVFTGPA